MRKSLAVMALAMLVLGTTVVLAGSAAADEVGYCVYDAGANTMDCSNCHSVGEIPRVETHCVIVLS